MFQRGFISLRPQPSGGWQVTILLDVHGVGFNDGTAYGRATLTNDRGTVMISLTGPAQTKLSCLPQHFTYKVIGATGAYRNLTDAGTLRLVRIPATRPFMAGIEYIELGIFQIIIG